MLALFQTRATPLSFTRCSRARGSTRSRLAFGKSASTMVRRQSFFSYLGAMQNGQALPIPHPPPSRARRKRPRTLDDKTNPRWSAGESMPVVFGRVVGRFCPPEAGRRDVRPLPADVNFHTTVARQRAPPSAKAARLSLLSPFLALLGASRLKSRGWKGGPQPLSVR